MVALWLVSWTPYRAVWVPALARDIVLYSWAKHLNLHCLSSIHVFTFNQLPGNIGPFILFHAMRSSSTTAALSFPAVPRQISLLLPRRLFPSGAQVNAVYLEDSVFLAPFFVFGPPCFFSNRLSPILMHLKSTIPLFVLTITTKEK